MLGFLASTQPTQVHFILTIHPDLILPHENVKSLRLHVAFVTLREASYSRGLNKSQKQFLIFNF
jgi:hypothetical protein